MGAASRSPMPMTRPRMAAAAALVLPLALPIAAARAGNDLNPDIETMCQGLALINNDIGATVAPGSPMSQRMQTELSISAAQYGALWSLMKLTPTTTCKKLY